MLKKDNLNRRSFLTAVGFGTLSMSIQPLLFRGSETNCIQSTDDENSVTTNLVERLGYAPDSRLLIINGDDFGESHAANMGIIKALEAGLTTTASLMMPAPWVMEAVEYIKSHPKVDVGVHLTLTGPSGGVRRGGVNWRPLCSRYEVPGLYSPDGYMWKSGREVWEHASPEEVKRECRAQIKKALELGIDIVKLDPHDGLFSANYGEFGKIYGELGQEFGLPLRMPSQKEIESLGYPKLRAEISKRGVLMSDEWSGVGEKKLYIRRLHELPLGSVMDTWIHPAVECNELKAISGNWWKERVEELRFVTEDRDLRQVIEEERIIPIGWREIRELQRSTL